MVYFFTSALMIDYTGLSGPGNLGEPERGVTGRRTLIMKLL